MVFSQGRLRDHEEKAKISKAKKTTEENCSSSSNQSSIFFTFAHCPSSNQLLTQGVTRQATGNLQKEEESHWQSSPWVIVKGNRIGAQV